MRKLASKVRRVKIIPGEEAREAQRFSAEGQEGAVCDDHLRVVAEDVFSIWGQGSGTAKKDLMRKERRAPLSRAAERGQETGNAACSAQIKVKAGEVSHVLESR
jgi:hypothetical protein